MFIDSQRSLMENTQQLYSTTSAIYVPEKNKFLDVCEQEYRERVQNTVSAIFLSFIGIVDGICRGLDELIAGIITLREQPFKNCAVHLIAALLQSVSLPIIGLINIFTPKTALAIIEVIAGLERGIFDNVDFNSFGGVTRPSTILFSETEAKIFSPFRGILCGINFVAKTIYDLANLIFELPVYNGEQFNVKGTILYTHAISVYIFIESGIRGIFDNESCDDIDVNILGGFPLR